MIEDGALGSQAHEERDQSEERRQEEEAEAAQEDVRAPLQHPVPPRDGRLVQEPVHLEQVGSAEVSRADDVADRPIDTGMSGGGPES